MTLSIEIDVLRGLNERCPEYSFNRRDLVNLAEYVAGEIARARPSQMLFSEMLVAGEPPRPAPETPDVQPEPPDSQPEAVNSQPETVSSQPDTPPEKQLKATKPSTCAFGRVWSEQDDAQLIRLKASGMTWGAIAAELNRTSRSAQQRYLKLDKLGAVPAPKDSPPKPEAVAQASKPQNGPKPITPAPAIVPATTRVSDVGDLSPLNIRQRALVIHLANLSDDFAPVDDLDIVEGLMAGKKTTVIADELGCRPDDINKRWRAMLTADVVNHHGTPTIDGQQDVLAAARHLVKCVEGAHG